MMNKSKKWVALCAALALTTLCGGAALAATGDKNDPLVTKSYLDQTVIPNVVSQVEAKAATRQTELQNTFAAQIEQYQKDIAAMGTGGRQQRRLHSGHHDQRPGDAPGCGV